MKNSVICALELLDYRLHKTCRHVSVKVIFDFGKKKALELDGVTSHLGSVYRWSRVERHGLSSEKLQQFSG